MAGINVGELTLAELLLTFKGGHTGRDLEVFEGFFLGGGEGFLFVWGFLSKEDYFSYVTY